MGLNSTNIDTFHNLFTDEWFLNPSFFAIHVPIIAQERGAAKIIPGKTSTIV